MRWAPLLLLGLVLIVYGNSFGNGLVADDRGLIINAPLWTFDSIFSPPYATPYAFIRQLFYVVFYKLFGLNPFIFRFLNIAFHAGSVLLLFVILKKIANTKIAFLASCLFAVHPILVESVTWISGGVYAQYSFFFLASFLCYINAAEKGKRWYIASVVLFILSLMSSEKAVILFLVFPLYEITLGNLKRSWRRLPIFLFLSGLWTLLYLQKLGTRQFYIHVEQTTEPQPYNPFLQIPISITSYLELLLWPDKLTLYHTEMTFSQFDYIVRLIGFLFLLALAGFFFMRNRFLFFWFAFFFVTLIPTLAPIGLAWIVAERYVYLGTIGIFVFFAWVFAKIIERKQLRTIAAVFFAVIIIGLSIRTITRNVDWYNEDNLWLASARTSPSSSQNHNNLGDYYGRHGDLVNAEKEFKQAIELKPNYADAYHNLGNVYRDLGRFDDAIAQYEKALSFYPGLWQSYQNIAVIYYERGEYEKAKEYIEKGVAIDSQNPNLRLIQGFIYVKTNELEKAKELLLQILKLDPENQFAQQGLQEIGDRQ